MIMIIGNLQCCTLSHVCVIDKKKARGRKSAHVGSKELNQTDEENILSNNNDTQQRQTFSQ